jgi:hypothetical protein
MTPNASPFVLAFSCTLAVAPAAKAQELPRHVRITVGTAAAEARWEGSPERLSPDSLYLRVRGADTVAVFSRTAIRSAERRRVVNSGRIVGAGCVAGGVALGALGYFGTHDPDSPGLEKTFGLIGLGVGCLVGGAGGIIVSAVRGHGWEPWTLPTS